MTPAAPEALVDQAITLAMSAAFVKAGNPRVGCVIVDDAGTIVGSGAHLGSGTAHAEVVALAEAGPRSAGAHVFVTLEPCRHTGRTPPCTDALIAAGVASVTYAVRDPGAHSGGGADVLVEHGIDVAYLPHAAAEQLVHDWSHVQRTGRPYIIGKCAMSLDGRVAQPSGAPWPLTGAAANAQSHRIRAEVDAIVVGTGTLITDDPALTARTPDGELHERQPAVFVIGERAVPPSASVHERGVTHIDSRDVSVAMRALVDQGIERVLLEGGPTLLDAWINAGVVDELRWSVSPVIMGAGPRAAVGDQLHNVPLDVMEISVMEQDVVVRARLKAQE